MKAGWDLRRVGDVCEIVNGGTPKTGVREYWGGDHLWITPAEMGKRSSPYVDATVRTLTDVGLQNCSARLLPPFSVILSSRAPIGHLVINAKPMATNQGCKGLVPSNLVDHKYLYYYLGSIVGLLNELGTGATFKELSGSDLRGVEIPLPPILDQQRIVASLDEAFAAIANVSTKTQESLSDAIELFESYLNTVFTPRSEQWRDAPLGELCEILDARRIPITKRDRVAGDIPYYGATGIQDRVEGFIFDEPLVLVGEDGAKWGPDERSAFAIQGKSWVNNHAHVLRPNRQVVLDEWLIYSLNHFDLNDFVSGLTVQKLNQGNLREIPIPLPPLSFQRKLIGQAQTVEEGTERLASLYQRKLAALTALRQSLLHHAFTDAH